MDTNASPNDPQPPLPEAMPESPAIAPTQPIRKKRRWWFYVLIVFATLLCLGITALIGISSYYKFLVRTYTSTQPVPLASVEASADAVRELMTRFEEFSTAVQNRQYPNPFKIAADEINRIIATNDKTKDVIRLIIAGNQLTAQFSVPLDQTHKKELKGRFLNGLAMLKLEFVDGFLKLNVNSLDANGKPIPNWILNKLKGKNILSDLEGNFDFLQLLQELEL